MKAIIKSVITFLIISAMLFTSMSSSLAFASQKEDVATSERYHVIENGYKNKYNLQEGIFGHQSSQQVNKSAVYFYSDGYFSDSPEVYNPSLSTMSLSFALSAFNAKQTDFDFSLPSGEYSNLFRHAKVLLSDIGIEEKDIYINESFDVRPTEDSIGMIMGAKEITIDSENYLLLPIALRGGDYEAEWASNVTLGTSGEALGFSSSAAKIISQIENYINFNTSFDIATALKEGRVKFWIVGYSRPGAVANITAKRLTDVYGQAGNDIYSYTFEAPAGGVDAAAINESWTYNGIYANIHNIINTSDLIPHVAPKQMGFKRYGVDHYVPGTDAGEIKASTYVTPTGITVTTYADNEAYIVGNADYNDRRTEMLHYLSCINSKIVFSDDFSLATIDLMGAILNGELFEPIESGENVTAAQWLESFISDLLNHAANGTYNNGKQNNGGYDNDYREFYTTHTSFAGKNHVTLEVSLQHVIKTVSIHSYNEEFLYAMLYRFASLELDYSLIFDFYYNVIQRWDKLSTSAQDKYLDKIWDCLNGELILSDGTSVKKITDFVDEDEKALLEDSVYTLASFLFLFISKDYNRSPSLEGTNETFVHMVTLIANAKTLLQGHFPEICLSWLCTYDENYSSENTSSIYTNSEITLINDENNMPPEVEFKIDVEEGKSTLSLSTIIKSTSGVDANSKNNGAAIYFAIFENGNIVNDWQLYRNPIVFDTTSDAEYTVKAFAVRFEEMGEEIEITNEQIRTPQAPPEDTENNTQTEEPGTPSENTSETPSQNSNQNISLIVIAFGVILLLAVSTVIFVHKKRKK